MAERKPIQIEPESEVGQLLRRVGDQPLVIEASGVRYRIEREEVSPFSDYDPARVLSALRRSAGVLAGVDIETFKQEIREQRIQSSKGRPD